MKQANHSIHVHWDRRYPKKGTDKCPVQLGININGLQFKVGLKLYATREDFDKAMSGKSGNQEVKELRAEISKYTAKAEQILEHLPNPTRETFQRLFRSEVDLKKGKTDIKILFNDYIDELRKEDRIRSAKNVEQTYRSFKRYKEKLYLEEINEAFLKGYQSWMLSIGNSITTAQIYLRNLRAVFNRAIKAGFIAKRFYPFINFPIGASAKSKNVLYPVQVKALFDYAPKSIREHRAKDMWMFCYLMNGINPADLFALRNKNIQGDYIVFVREKTKRTNRVAGKEIRAYLHPEMKRIIADWGLGSKDPEAYVFPYLVRYTTAEGKERRKKALTKQFNKKLKAIGQRLGIKTPIIMNLARHSFSTNLKLNETPATFIKDALGHSSLAVTEHYLKSIPDDKIKDISKSLLNFE